MSFKIVSEKKFTVGESPRWNYEDHTLWFTDVPEQKLISFDPKTEKFSELKLYKNISGFSFNADGRIICATHNGVYIANRDGDMELIAEEFEGEYLKCNDCTADAKGRFLFGTSFYDPGFNQGALGSLYIMDTDRSIKRVDTGIRHSNGIGFSPNGDILYFTDCASRIIYAYDYDLNTGNISNKRIFVKVPPYEGIPDGLAVDSYGYVWSAQWYGGVVIRYTPEGEKDFIMRTPGQQTSSLTFGGDGLMDIYVTSASRWAYLDDTPINYEYEVLPPGGELYCFNYQIPGYKIPYAKII